MAMATLVAMDPDGKLVQVRVDANGYLITTPATPEVGMDVRALEATYDFDVHGGAIGEIGLGVFLPAGAVFVELSVQTTTEITGSGSLQGRVLGTGIQVTAQPTAGRGVIGSYATVFEPGLLVGGLELGAEIVNDTITAGKFRVFVTYFVPEAA